MYDPTIGRFITADPEGFEAGDANLYRYVRNGPTNATDPSGMQERITQGIASTILGPLVEHQGVVGGMGFGVGLPPVLNAGLMRGQTREEWLRGRDSGLRVYLMDDGTSFRVQTTNFTGEERARLAVMLGHLRNALDEVLRDIRNTVRITNWEFDNWFQALNPTVQTRIRRWFNVGGDGYVSNHDMDRIYITVQQVRRAFDNRTLYFQNDFEQGNDTAWVTPIFSDIHLSPEFWDRPQRRQIGIIFHEMTHFYAWTNDLGGYYRPRSLVRLPLPLPPLNGGLAGTVGPVLCPFRPPVSFTASDELQNNFGISNADNYEGFLEDYYLNNIPW